MGRHIPAGFTINNLAYFGLGQNINTVTYNDLWEYNPLTDIWTQKASMPGATRCGSANFAIGNFGYVCCGWTNTVSPTQLNDVWKYDVINNTWAQAAAFPGPGRYTSSSFVINNKAYVGIGFMPLQNDFYEYDAINNSWAAKANYPLAVQSCATFSLNNKGYFVGGNNSNPLNLVYEYDPVGDSWAQKNNFPITTSGAFSFVINNIPYVGMGISQFSPNVLVTPNVYSYNITTDTWTLVSIFPSFARSSSPGVCIGNAGYIFAGNDQTSGNIVPTNELWKFTPNTTGIQEQESIELSIFFDVINTSLVVTHESNENLLLNVIDLAGKVIEKFEVNSKSKILELNREKYSHGIYFYFIEIKSSNLTRSGKFLLH